MYFFFFFPVGTDARTRFPPVGTATVLGICLALFLVRIPAPGLYIDLVLRSFVPVDPRLPAAVLSLFLHGSWWHLLGNALYLWIFGKQLEGKLGIVRFGVIFLVGGVLSCFIQAWATPPGAARIPLIGASGAVAAILGATIVRFRHQRVKILYVLFAFLGGLTKGGVVHLNTLVACLAWFVYQIAHGLAAQEGGGGGIAYAAHVGGFVAGTALAFLLGLHHGVKREIHRRRGRRYFERGDWFAAAGELTTHLDHAPDDFEAGAMRARCYALLGRSGEASAEYLRLFRDARGRKNVEQSSRLYREIRAYGMNSNLSDSGLLRVAFDFRKAGRPGEAAEVFREITNRFPEGPKAELALIRRAELLWSDLGALEQAKQCYRQLLENYPESEWREIADSRIRSMRVLTGRSATGSAPSTDNPTRPERSSAAPESSS